VKNRLSLHGLLSCPLGWNKTMAADKQLLHEQKMDHD